MNAQEIVKALTPLADKLGQTASAIYAQYYRQAYVNGIQNLIWIAVCLVAIPLLSRGMIKGIKDSNKSGDEDTAIAIGLLGGLIWLGLGVLLFTNINFAIDNFVNPGYQATQMLIHQVRGAN